MDNGIKQSRLSPLLFHIYVVQLNVQLNATRINAAGRPTNTSYTDDLAVVCPSASDLNELLVMSTICGYTPYFIQFYEMCLHAHHA